ncbi:MAG: hypothetical protein H6745_26635 [Deltaproteobacteria bacterium]|nr:hypothetical protein [Deltaproteobacteria bacterium]
MRPISTTLGRYAIAATLFAGLGFTACSDSGSGDSDTTPTAAEYDDVATTTGALVADPNGGEVTAMHQAYLIARGQAPLFLTAGASGAIQGAQWGLSFSYDVTCMNADGDEITCGADTDSARVVASWSGSWDGTWLDADTAWEADWELTGLQGDTWVLNGSSSVDWSASWDNPHNGAHREWSVQASAAADDLTFAASARRPVGGTASYYLQIDRVGEGPNGEAQGNLTVDADVTFSDSGATLVLDGSRDYSLNVTTGDTSAQ